MLFPKLTGSRFGYVNLNICAEEYLTETGWKPGGRNPLVDAEACQRFVGLIHERLAIDFSYGGWLEKRDVLWRDSYLSAFHRFVHLGVDFNVPAGTAIASDLPLRVIVADDDNDQDGGWGKRVVAQVADLPLWMIFAHLGDVAHFAKYEGARIHPGMTFAEVGESKVNGGWFPHLHLQLIDRTWCKTALADIDGYGHQVDINNLARCFPDPLPYIRLW
jgi:hypothetical protein